MSAELFPKVKPRLARRFGRWVCVGGFGFGYGPSPRAAYREWYSSDTLTKAALLETRI